MGFVYGDFVRRVLSIEILSTVGFVHGVFILAVLSVGFCPCEFSPLLVLSTEGFVRLFFSMAFYSVGFCLVGVLSSGGFIYRGFCLLRF